MISTKIGLSGHFMLRDVKDGKMLVDIDNLVVNGGKEWVAEIMCAGTEKISNIQIGTTLDTADPQLTETALKAMLDSFTIDNGDGDYSGATATYHRLLSPAEGEGAITEAGLFTDLVRMFSRVVFPVINKGPADEYEIIWVITVI